MLESALSWQPVSHPALNAACERSNVAGRSQAKQGNTPPGGGGGAAGGALLPAEAHLVSCRRLWLSQLMSVSLQQAQHHGKGSEVQLRAASVSEQLARSRRAEELAGSKSSSSRFLPMSLQQKACRLKEAVEVQLGAASCLLGEAGEGAVAPCLHRCTAVRVVQPVRQLGANSCIWMHVRSRPHRTGPPTCCGFVRCSIKAGCKTAAACC